MKLLD